MASLETIEALIIARNEQVDGFHRESKESFKKINDHLARINGRINKHDSTLYGSGEGDEGLCRQLNDLTMRFLKFRLTCVLIAGILIGTGALGGYGIAQLLA